MLQQHTTPASAKANAARASTAQAMPGISLTLNRLGRLTDSVSGCFGSLDASHWQCTPQPNQPASPPTEKRPSVNVSPRSAGEDHCVVEKIHEPSASSSVTATPATTTIPWNCLLDVCCQAAPVAPAEALPTPAPPLETTPTCDETIVVVAGQCGTPGCELAEFHCGPCTSQCVSGKRQPRPSARVLEATVAVVAAPRMAGIKRALSPDENAARARPDVAPAAKRRLPVATPQARAPLATMPWV